MIKEEEFGGDDGIKLFESIESNYLNQPAPPLNRSKTTDINPTISSLSGIITSIQYIIYCTPK